MLNKRLEPFNLILASQSPRRQYLLKELGLDFKVVVTHAEEVWPDGLSPAEVAVFLANLKADEFETVRIPADTIIIAADTLVVLDDEILGKPSDYDEAVSMLQKLSGRKHEVITAVCLKSRERRLVFNVRSDVYFRDLTGEEIDFYIRNFQPFDKAGGYGVQEWIGYIGISRIEGSFFNIMGLPVKELYEALITFCGV